MTMARWKEQYDVQFWDVEDSMKSKVEPGMVVYAYNPSYSGAGG
jgi:hypothetical protein